MKKILPVFLVALSALLCGTAHAQKYSNGLIDKSVAVVGNELITLSMVEQEVQMMRAQGMHIDQNSRCALLENLMESKLLLMQARLDSLSVNNDMVESQLNQRLDDIRTRLGGDDKVEEYFGKPVYKIRQEWYTQLQDMSLTQQEQNQIVSAIPELTPYDLKQYLDTVATEKLPVIPEKYKMSQICIYPDREAANMAVKEKLLEIRERINNGEKFSTLARLYSEDPGSASRGGVLGMASKNIFWPAFSDAAMALKPGTISQIVETPDGFHIIEVLEKKGDMFNARHILLKPRYTTEDQEKAFAKLDSIRTEILSKAMSFELAARFYSEDPATKTNGGQMADPYTGSAYFEIDMIKPQDYAAVKDLKEGEISKPIASLDNEGRNGNLVYKIIRLDKVIPAHTARFENDYTALLDEIRYIKQKEALDKFFDKKIKETYIVIDPLFKGCEFNRSGWAEKIRKD
ncbi:MAG: peptidylprolyl isomerase [Candidatus Cryptobacteroides sp.]|nr:peptidylprolyl isomerase [Candidatus Cryptobacteroides sp.]